MEGAIKVCVAITSVFYCCHVHPSQKAMAYICHPEPRTVPAPQGTATRRTYVLCLHHDESLEDAVHRCHQQSHAQGAATQDRKRLRVHRKIQTRPPRLFRAIRRCSQRDRTREAHQGMAAHQENRAHRFGESILEGFERGMVRASSIPAAERLGNATNSIVACILTTFNRASTCRVLSYGLQSCLSRTRLTPETSFALRSSSPRASR